MINVHHVRFLCRCLLQFFSGFPLVICGKQKLTSIVVHDLLHCETHTYDNSLSDFLFCCTHSIAEAIYQYWYFSIVPHGVSLSFFEETAPALVHGTPLC